MGKGKVIKRGIIVAAASALAVGYGCERPNSNKTLSDSPVASDDCAINPSTGSGAINNTTTGGNNNNPAGGNNTTTGGNNNTTTGGDNMNSGPPGTELDQRVVDYGEALRTASILLVGDAPTLEQINELEAAQNSPGGQAAKYQELIDGMFKDPRFAQTMIDFYRYTFKMGGMPDLRTNPNLTRDSAAIFAASLVVGDQPWTSLLEQTDNTCPTYDPNAQDPTKAFAPAQCMVPKCVADPNLPSDPRGAQSIVQCKFDYANVNGSTNIKNFPPLRVPVYQGLTTETQVTDSSVPIPPCPLDETQSGNSCLAKIASSVSPNVVQQPQNLMPSMPAGEHAGVLSNPAIMSVYFGNLAFRRNRFFQETFLCRSANEPSGAEPFGGNKDSKTQVACDDPKDQGQDAGTPVATFTNKWPLDAVAGNCNGGIIDFHTHSASNPCANCHATWNHRAPLFAVFDQQGIYHEPTAVANSGQVIDFQVQVPAGGNPVAQLSDWLCVNGQMVNDPQNPGQQYPYNSCPKNALQFAWKWEFGPDGPSQPKIDMTQPYWMRLQTMGKQMANDPEVIQCAVSRMWTYAMGRSDITEIGHGMIYGAWQSLPDRHFSADENARMSAHTMWTLNSLVDYFKSNNYNLRLVLRQIVLSDDFVRF